MPRLTYDVNIRGAANGLIVQVGCQTLVFQNADTEQFLTDLRGYLTGGHAALKDLAQKYCPDMEDIPGPPVERSHLDAGQGLRLNDCLTTSVVSQY
jgi:hypothetical protein